MTLKVVRTDMMNMEDGDGLDICERGDGARDAAHFPSVLPSASNITLNNVPNPDPNFSDPSTSIFALSSLRKLLLLGTLRIGPISHVGTFFVDCGADDVFMDSKLAEELKVPLTKLSNPIMLRLADGDFINFDPSNCPTAAAHWKACGDSVVFTSPVFVTDYLGYSWLEKHNPRINWVSRMVDFDCLTV
ncbi:hypothetical protein BASA83_010127 [Batrachochytrium salamandrivorans]|nr:hypothetical protein BASA83_010127 [Batrachochytrium salamandrivorans]